MIGSLTQHSSLSIAVLGGGVGGLALATLLARSGWKVTVFERRSEAGAAHEGAFLTLAANGVAALSAIGALEGVEAVALPTREIALHGRNGRKIVGITQMTDEDRNSRPALTIRRGELAAALLKVARAAGADILHESVAAVAKEAADDVTIAFGDGDSVQHFDAVVVSDGINSRSRRKLFPAAPSPTYTGLIGTGGFVDVPEIHDTDGVMHMTFGHRAFFGYIKRGDGPVYWFNSYPHDKPDASVAFGSGYAGLLRDLHAKDPEPVRTILAAVKNVDQDYPIFDMPRLECWHSDRAVLIGDAAHAVSPHAGQGASMTLEDAVVLHACLAHEPTLAQAFRGFEALRRDRVEEVIRISRRVGSAKSPTNPIAIFLRDLIMPIFVPMTVREQRRVARFRVDRDPLAPPG